MQPKGWTERRVKGEGKLTVRLLVASASSRSSELLGFASAWVGHQQGLVIGNELFLQLLLALLVHVLLVVGDKALGDGLTDRVDLSHVTASLNISSPCREGQVNLDANSDVDALVTLLADNEKWLPKLDAEDLGLEVLQRTSVDLKPYITKRTRHKP